MPAPPRRSLLIVAAGLAAVGLAAGCSSSVTAAGGVASGTSAGAPATAAATAAVTARSTPDGRTVSAGPARSTGSAAAARSSGSPDPAGSTGSTGECTLDQLSADLGAPRGDGEQRTVALTWTNVSSRTCTMRGFGGVDLVGPSDPNGSTYSLARSGQQPATVRLAPRGTAETVITILAPAPGSVGSNGSQNWTPTAAVVTPPDETHHRSVPWTAGPVERQDGATHPGTFISPVVDG